MALNQRQQNSIHGANHALCCPHFSHIGMQDNCKTKQEPFHARDAITTSIRDQHKQERKNGTRKITSRINKQLNARTNNNGYNKILPALLAPEH